MSEQPPNPPAFPTYNAEYDPRNEAPASVPGEHYLELREPGMSLGDYFAARALEGIIASQLTNSPDEAAAQAFAYAKAMLERRARGPE